MEADDDPKDTVWERVVVTAKSTIEKIQAVENRVWKYLLGLGGYTSERRDRGIHDDLQDNGNHAALFCNRHTIRRI